MTTDPQIPDPLLSAATTLGGINAEADRRIADAEYVRACLLGLSTLVLREQGFTDAFIAQHLGSEPKALSESMGAVRTLPITLTGLPDNGPQREVVQLWDAARQAASPWLQVEDVAYSHQVVQRHAIDASPWPLSVGVLDLLAREFVHQHSGEALILYSLQRWKGTPRYLPSGQPEWDLTGRYNIEFVTVAGDRGTVRPEALGLSDDEPRVHRREPVKRRPQRI
jgi:hypothetical protein